MTRKNSTHFPSSRFICDDYAHPAQEKLSNIPPAELYRTRNRKTLRSDREIQLRFEGIEELLINLRELIARRAELTGSLCWLSFIRRTEKQIDAVFDTAYKAEVSFRQKMSEIRRTNHNDEL